MLKNSNVQFLFQIYKFRYLFVKDERVEEDVNFALSAFIFAVSLFLVSENCVAMTTKHRLIMKKDPT